MAHQDDLAVGVHIVAGEELARVLQGEDEEDALDEADGDGEVAGVLGELLPADITLLLEAAEGRHNSGHQLEDDGGADVRHDAQRTDGALEERAAGEHVVESHEAAAAAGGLRLEEAEQRLRIDARQGDVRAHARDEEQAERVEDPRAQLGDLHGVGEGRKHVGVTETNSGVAKAQRGAGAPHPAGLRP